MKYSIVVPTYQHCDDLLKPCLESVKTYTDLADAEVVVVANGCTDGTKAYVESLGTPFRLVWSDAGLGFTKAANEGIKAAKGDVIILLNNDVVLLPQNKNHWINLLLGPLHGDVGVTCPLKLYSQEADRKFAVGFCMAVRTEVFGACGFLDEIFSPGWGEDMDLSWKAEAAGYRVLQVPHENTRWENGVAVLDFPIYHKGEGTMLDTEHKPGWSDIVERNKKIIQTRYGLPAGWFYGGDIEEYRRLMEAVPEGGVVCELGCAIGRSLCSVAEIIKRKKLKVFAVDTFAGTENEKTPEQKLIKLDYEAECQANFARYGIQVTTIKATTDEALVKFEDKSLDLLFIDADHAYRAVLNDITNWLPKVRGVISGHDYGTHPGVQQAVWEKFGKTRVSSYIWSKDTRKPSVLVYLNTFKRTDSTLPMAILSLINQTHKPDKLIVFDDNKEFQNLDKIEHYKYLFDLALQKGIDWEYRPGQQKGAHFNHETANLMGYDLAWFIDDDHVAEPTCLEELMKEMTPDTGAVGGLIPMDFPAKPLPKGITNNRIADLTKHPNIQWFMWSGPAVQVEHIYSSFLYRCNIVHHDLRLSSVAFRGESMFTYSLHLKGYKLKVTPCAITWHFQGGRGGCRG